MLCPKGFIFYKIYVLNKIYVLTSNGDELRLLVTFSLRNYFNFFNTAKKLKAIKGYNCVWNR